MNRYLGFDFFQCASIYFRNGPLKTQKVDKFRTRRFSNEHQLEQCG